MTPQKLFGVFNINKPAGLSSRQVVDCVGRKLKSAKLGHAGTLDPLATGVLVVCVGRATRLVPFIQDQPKEYRARFELGRRSNTDDITGDVVTCPPAHNVTRRQVEDLLTEFAGDIQQIPPQFSAVHVQGQRAYQLARRGKTVVLQPRRVRVHRIELVGFSYPEFELAIECGSGTYIRSIGRDLGERLGCGAVLCELERTRVGPFRRTDAIALEQLETADVCEFLLPATTAVGHLPRHVCQPGELNDLRCGRSIRRPSESSYADGTAVALVTPESDLACLAIFRREDQTLAPKLVFID